MASSTRAASVARLSSAAALSRALGEAEGEAGGEDASDQGLPKTKFAFEPDQLAWGRKEAKARLSPEEFKAWRKAAKAA